MNSNDWIPFKWDKEKENWLDCQLGEDEEEVLVTYVRSDGSRYVDTDIFMFDDQWYLDSGCAFVEEAIAWMPFPEPYTDERKMLDGTAEYYKDCEMHKDVEDVEVDG